MHDDPQRPIDNPELELAESFVEETDRHVFLTGRAGTGKTTFLRRLRKTSGQRMVVTAPTGVAAINARGVTLHSFFQLSFGPWVEGQDLGSHKAHRFRETKRRLVENLDLLVIDEISMVRADVLDAVDAVLRRLRRDERPFGGVQLLMIGDLGQLAPIATDEDWQILGRVYDSPYFFSSRALARTGWLALELKHVYRQNDRRFVEILDRVRDGRLDDATLERLHARHRPNFRPPEDEGWIVLSTHNRKVDRRNESRLERLDGPAKEFRAEVEGKFPESSYPAPEVLRLKVGAQVLFVRNDPSREKLYFNGKIGKVTRMEGDKVWVRCPGDAEEIEVEASTWENVRYRLDERTGEIEETKTGSFAQLPLKLAWAITIHKSQGLTFERAVIDAESAFAPGQVYVALSRCTTLEGLVLHSPIEPRAVRTDPVVQRFQRRALAETPGESDLEAARRDYGWRILRETFGFDALRRRLGDFLNVLCGNLRLLQLEGVTDPDAAYAAIGESFGRVSDAFLRQLESYREEEREPTSDALVLERIRKASAYFLEQLDEHVEPLLETKVETDNSKLAKKIERSRERLSETTAAARAALQACAEGYDARDVVRARARATTSARKKRRRRSSPSAESMVDIEHPKLVVRLRQWRTERADEDDVPPYRILHQKVLLRIARDLPGNETALESLHGVGPKTVEQYGDELLEIVRAYCRENDLEPAEAPKEKRKTTPEKGSSARTSFEMFEKGATVEEIAEERELATSTIEGHLSRFVGSGELDVGRLVSPEKQEAIAEAFDAHPDASLGEIKAALGDDYGWGELRLVQAARAAEELNGVD